MTSCNHDQSFDWWNVNSSMQIVEGTLEVEGSLEVDDTLDVERTKENVVGDVGIVEDR